MSAEQQIQFLQQENQERLARSIQVRSLLDNGTDATAIAPHVFQKLGLKSQVSGTSQTAAGQVTVTGDPVVTLVALTVSTGEGAATAVMRGLVAART